MMKRQARSWVYGGGDFVSVGGKDRNKIEGGGCKRGEGGKGLLFVLKLGIAPSIFACFLEACLGFLESPGAY